MKKRFGLCATLQPTLDSNKTQADKSAEKDVTTPPADKAGKDSIDSNKTQADKSAEKGVTTPPADKAGKDSNKTQVDKSAETADKAGKDSIDSNKTQVDKSAEKDVTTPSTDKAGEDSIDSIKKLADESDEKGVTIPSSSKGTGSNARQTSSQTGSPDEQPELPFPTRGGARGGGGPPPGSAPPTPLPEQPTKGTGPSAKQTPSQTGSPDEQLELFPESTLSSKGTGSSARQSPAVQGATPLESGGAHETIRIKREGQKDILRRKGGSQKASTGKEGTAPRTKSGGETSRSQEIEDEGMSISEQVRRDIEEVSQSRLGASAREKPGGTKRQLSPAEKQGRRRPSPDEHIKAKKIESFKEGEGGGRALAEQQGISVENFEPPQKLKGEFGRGIDDVGRTKRGNYTILEFKGGRGKLSEGQMSSEWVGRKIAQLKIINHPTADKLLRSAGRGNLEGRVYSTPNPQLKNPDTKMLNHNALKGDLPEETISPDGVIRYDSVRVREAYKKEIKRLRRAVKEDRLDHLINVI